MSRMDRRMGSSKGSSKGISNGQGAAPAAAGPARWALSVSSKLRVAAGAVLLLAGCAGVEPPSALLALPAPAAASTPAVAASGAAGAPRWLAVRRVVVPEYLQARAVRYRADDATLAAWPQTVWAERIEVAVTRNLVAALQAQLAAPGWTVCDGLCPGIGAQPLLNIEFTQADLLRGARVLRTQLRWTLTAPGASAVLAHGEAAFDEALQADTAAGHAQALGRAVERAAGLAAAGVLAGK